MIALIDMGLGNLQSVRDALGRLGADVVVARAPDDLKTARAIVLPGVGAFADGMANLASQALVDPIVRAVRERGIPLLGICLGMHLLAEEGEEHGRHRGLGLVPGRVVRLESGGASRRVPHLGWADVTVVTPSPILPEVPDSLSYYFAHSYVMSCADPSAVIAAFDHGGPQVAAVRRGSAHGVQFHPEKSHDDGIDVLDRFVGLAGVLP